MQLISSRSQLLGWALGLSFFGAVAAGAQEPTGVIAGTVVHDANHPVTDAEVTLVELHRVINASADGAFRFEGLPPGRYTVLADSPTDGSGLVQLRLDAGATVELVVKVELSMLQEELVVTASASPRSQLDLAQPTNVLSDEELAFRQQSSLGETLETQPGITATYFGPGASRPVIRGIGGDRVRMLSDGLGSADASNTSPDHAVALEPVAAERIEVIRGPATLLYGSSAVGGVVNVLDERVPVRVPEKPIGGSVELVLGSVADERTGLLSLDGGRGQFAWHVDFLKRETDDYEIPGFAEAAHGEEEHEGEEEEVEGVLENSAQETESGAVGFSWVADRFTLGVAASGYDTLYGVPGHGHEEEGGEEEGGEEEEEEGAVRIDLEQRRLDLKGEIRQEFGFLRGIKFRVGRNDYEHVELEGEEIGTRFTNEGFEGRLELVQRQMGRLAGSFGVQVGRSDFEAIGEEAFVPPSTTDTLAAFTYQSLDLDEAGRLRLDFGARYERQETDPESDQRERTLDGVSGSVGAVWSFVPGWTAALSVNRTDRLPTSNELYADGPHAGTRAFEIGNPDFDKEKSLGVDLSIRKREGRVTGGLTVFQNRFDDYIFERFTGEVEDGLQVIQFTQGDAEFKGVEGELQIDVFEKEDSHLALQFSGDTVRAELTTTGEPLPRIPPRRLAAGFNFHNHRLRGFAEVRRVEEQDRLSANETETDGFTLVNASASYRFLFGNLALDLVLNGRNLTDEEARVHTSFLKDLAPLPGRDVSLGVRLYF